MTLLVLFGAFSEHSLPFRYPVDHHLPGDYRSLRQICFSIVSQFQHFLVAEVVRPGNDFSVPLLLARILIFCQYQPDFSHEPILTNSCVLREIGPELYEPAPFRTRVFCFFVLAQLLENTVFSSFFVRRDFRMISDQLYAFLCFS